MFSSPLVDSTKRILRKPCSSHVVTCVLKGEKVVYASTDLIIVQMSPAFPFQATLYSRLKGILAPLYTRGVVTGSELTRTKLPREKPVLIILFHLQLSSSIKSLLTFALGKDMIKKLLYPKK
ncbi:hypothetical protein TNCV_2644561 [Trichonephila clavipes]|nr:hypothetical protein TNCV_2644561 [Trichonephila clavipes]